MYFKNSSTLFVFRIHVLYFIQLFDEINKEFAALLFTFHSFQTVKFVFYTPDAFKTIINLF